MKYKFSILMCVVLMLTSNVSFATDVIVQDADYGTIVSDELINQVDVMSVDVIDVDYFISNEIKTIDATYLINSNVDCISGEVINLSYTSNDYICMLSVNNTRLINNSNFINNFNFNELSVSNYLLMSNKLSTNNCKLNKIPIFDA